MTNPPTWPTYNNSLSDFLGDLRSNVSPSQARLARSLNLSHTTISRYENDRMTPPSGYMMYLSQLYDERFSRAQDDTEQEERRAWLIIQLNQALERNYGGEPLVSHWSDVERAAQAYFAERMGETQEISGRQIEDWADAPDTRKFYGREQDMQQLEAAIIQQRCRLITIAGMGGIGKTHFTSRLGRTVAPDFEFIIWRSLRNAPSLEHLVDELCTVLLADLTAVAAQSLDQKILRLLEFMKAHRCLIVLDNLESIMDTSDRMGYYRDSYEDYEPFFDTVATHAHQSCLILTSREVPTKFELLIKDDDAVQVHYLLGLTDTNTPHILKLHDVEGSPEAIQRLTELYSGNPMALKLVAYTINNMFEGDLEEFLSSEMTVFNDIRHLLDRMCSPLKPLSLEILYWLAVLREPVKRSTLAKWLVPQRRIDEIVDSLDVLRRSSLIELADHRYSLPNVISEYLIDRLRKTLEHEFRSGDLHFFHRIALLNTHAPDYVRKTQARLLIAPLVDWLQVNTPARNLRTRFENLIEATRTVNQRFDGFAPGNLLNIMVRSQHDLYQYDFSGLTLQHVNLAGTTLAHIDFTGSMLKACVFDNTFVGINTVALSRRGNLLAIASGSDIRLWQVGDNQLHFAGLLTGNRALIWHLMFTSAEDTLFSLDDAGTVICWDVLSRQRKFVIQLPTPLLAMALHPSQPILATSSKDGMIYLWNTHDGSLDMDFSVGLKVQIKTLAFDPQGIYLATGGTDGTIRLWHLHQQAWVATFKEDGQAITSLAFAQNGELLVSNTGSHKIKIWEVDSGQERATLEGHVEAISALCVSQDGETLVSSSYDRHIKIWNLRDQKPEFVLDGHDLPVSSIALDETGTLLVSGSYDRTVRMWSVREGLLENITQGLTFQMRTLAFSSDGCLVAAGSSDYNAYLWDAQSGQLLKTFRGHKRWVDSVDFHPDKAWLATGSYDRTVRVWDIDSGDEVVKLGKPTNWVQQVGFSPDGAYLVAADVHQTLSVWDTKTFKHNIITCPAPIQQFALHPASSAVAVACKDGTVHIWDLATCELITTYFVENVFIETLAFSSDGQRLSMMSDDGQVIFWQIEQSIVKSFETHIPLEANYAMNDDGRYVATYYPNNMIDIWDLEAGKLRQSIHDKRERITTVTFNMVSQRLAVGDEDGVGHIWDIATGDKVSTFKMQRPYEGMNITNAKGLSSALREMLKSLGAVEDTEQGR